MTTTEYIQSVLQIKKDTPSLQSIDEAPAYEAAQLISGSFTYPLYEELWANFFDMDAVTEHLENLYDSGNYFGMIYFTFMLANAVEFIIPIEFTEMSAKDAFVPVLAAAIIEDWLEYDGSFEATAYEG
jgi:hypothetical protein